ncbi:ankyrin repeat domain-containing protein 50 [Macrosteles quadrilineatus]|uniref:ankyrin repeat domain-containing protein 50 n=1 Tax=Macrosteles quadrilineatus TaxID=74068 RepID=UPI0023E10DFB|nr:ankyrin repeat domain-containing protein 50 [Macrosteles quadrilineatus]
MDKSEPISSNNGEPSSSDASPLPWPSLWKNGPRRSAFQPYKPSPAQREVTVPRPASTTVMTNLQRGNIQAETTPAISDLSWFTLAGRGDITEEQLQEMVAQGKDLNAVDDEGLSALMWAAYHGQIHTVSALLRVDDGRLEVDWAGMWGETALMLAAGQGHLEIVRLLVSAGADVNHQDHCFTVSQSGETALMCATQGDHPHTVSELLSSGANLTVINNNRLHSLSGETALMCATQGDHPHTSGETALMCATQGDHPHTVSELLSSGANLTVKNNNDCTAYDIAIDHQSLRSKTVLEKYMLSLLTIS